MRSAGPVAASCPVTTGSGRGRLRLRWYAVAPREHVLRPWVVSSLFPHLRRRSRGPFRVGLATLIMLLAGFAVLRWQAPMIAIAAVGFPSLFITYLREIDVRQIVSLRSLILASAIGVVLGVGWAYIAGTVFAEGYDVALGFETPVGPTVAAAVAISIAEVLLMLVPALVVRVLSKSTPRIARRVHHRFAWRDRLHRGGDRDAAGAAVGRGTGGR